jgi:hypothetical protein
MRQNQQHVKRSQTHDKLHLLVLAHFLIKLAPHLRNHGALHCRRPHPAQGVHTSASIALLQRTTEAGYFVVKILLKMLVVVVVVVVVQGFTLVLALATRAFSLSKIFSANILFSACH